MFPNGKANELNFVLFSTSGVHGTYITIEDIEKGFKKYGNEPSFLSDEDLDNPNADPSKVPDDWSGTQLTICVVHPRIVGVGYGNIEVKPEDISFLKKLRKTSWAAVQKIGKK